MVGVNMLMQLMSVVAQNHNLKKDMISTMLREIIYLPTFVKPAVEAHRVASGVEQQPGQAMDAMSEMEYSRGFEMVTEAIPGLVLAPVELR